MHRECLARACLALNETTACVYLAISQDCAVEPLEDAVDDLAGGPIVYVTLIVSLCDGL